MAAVTKKGLGKGFDALVPRGYSVQDVTTPTNEKIHMLAIDIVRPRSDQPRKHFDEQLLEQLAQSIKEQGVLQPIIVTKTEHNLYSIVAGERRWRASQIAGLLTIPAIVRQVDELQHLELSLLENIQRSDLNAIETAESIERLHNDFAQSYEDIAKRLGKAYTTIVNSVRLLQLPIEIRQALIEGRISEGHARALLALAKVSDQQMQLFNDILSKKLSVRQTEAIAAQLKSQPNLAAAKTNQQSPAASDKAQELSSRFGVPVTMSRSTKKGKITLQYNTPEEYERIINRLSQTP